MKDKMFYFLLGFMSMSIIAIIILSLHPIPETTQSCNNCGMDAWYIKLAEGDE